MKKILIISYYFPPSGGGGVQRITKFVKYLMHHGWRSLIITADEKSYIEKDFTLINELDEEIKIHRIPSLLSKKISQKVRYHFNVSWPWDSPQQGSTDVRSHIIRSLRNILLIPDSQIFWVINVLPKLSSIVNGYKPQAVLVTAPPFSVFILGLFIKIKYHIPLILDYRDPWTQLFESYRKYEYQIRRRIEIWLEKKSLRNADAIITTTKQIQIFIQKYVPDSYKINILTNGYDPQDYDGIVPYHFNRFSFVYTGKVTPYEYSAAAFLKGLSAALNLKPELRSKIEVHFFGSFNDPASDRLIENNHLNTIVTKHGYLEHTELLKYQLGSDVLLLLLNDQYTEKYILLGKLFEYIFTKKTIFSIIPATSPMIEVLKSANQSNFVTPDNIDKISESIIDFINTRNIMVKYTCSVELYNREKITKKLADLLNMFV